MKLLVIRFFMIKKYFTVAILAQVFVALFRSHYKMTTCESSQQANLKQLYALLRKVHMSGLLAYEKRSAGQKASRNLLVDEHKNDLQKKRQRLQQERLAELQQEMR